jgi:hypothetical protein
VRAICAASWIEKTVKIPLFDRYFSLTDAKRNFFGSLKIICRQCTKTDAVICAKQRFFWMKCRKGALNFVQGAAKNSLLRRKKRNRAKRVGTETKKSLDRNTFFV